MSTIDGFNAAWAAYLAALAGHDDAAEAGAREALYSAAAAHAATSRPLSSVTSYYAALNGDPAADPAAVAEIAQELDGVRRAAAVLAGAWPGTAPVVSTGG